MQKCGPLQADVYKRRFHAGQHSAGPAFVDVANQTALTGALNQNFLQDAILDHGDPGFAGRDVNQDFVARAAFGTCGHTVSIHRGK
jgi:hypothetical protein